jgi:type I restriction enzyme S subunit
VNRANGSAALVGISVYVSKPYPNRYLPDKIWQLVAHPERSTGRYLGLVTSVPRFRDEVKNRSSGGTGMRNIGSGRYLEIDALFPPLPEQRKIADILGAWDEALEKLDALIAAKDRRKKAVMQQLLTGKRRLPRHRKPWNRSKLGALFTERAEMGRPDLPLLSITADRGVIRRDGTGKRDTSSDDKSRYLRIEPGDIGYNTMRMWQGVSALSTMEGIVSPAYTICIPGERIVGRFAAHFFKLPHTISLFHRHSQGLVDDTLNLKFPNFAVIEVLVPSDPAEQTAIANILDAADAELRLLRRQRTAIDQQKRGLMQRLLTGQLRVQAA